MKICGFEVRGTSQLRLTRAVNNYESNEYEKNEPIETPRCRRDYTPPSFSHLQLLLLTALEPPFFLSFFGYRRRMHNAGRGNNLAGTHRDVTPSFLHSPTADNVAREAILRQDG